MIVKSLEVTRNELMSLLKNRNVMIQKGYNKEQLLRMLEYYGQSDPLKIAQIRGVNVTEGNTFDGLYDKLITNVHLKKAHKELISSYSDRMDNIRKQISDYERRRYLKSEQDKITKA